MLIGIAFFTGLILIVMGLLMGKKATSGSWRRLLIAIMIPICAVVSLFIPPNEIETAFFPQPATETPPGINQQEAITRALQIANSYRGSGFVQGQMGEPRHIQADVVKFSDAAKRPAQGPICQLPLPEGNPTKKVWLIRIEGDWAVGGVPFPKATSPAVVWQHYWIVLDANTGEPIYICLDP